MNEIESKFRVEDHNPWQATVNMATDCVEYDQRDIYFDGTGLMDADMFMRIRILNNNSTYLIFKGPKIDHAEVRTRPEHEVLIRGVEELTKILSYLNLEPVLEVKKHRVSYKVRDCKVEFDTVENLGKFIEVEGPSPESVIEVIRIMGMQDLSADPMGYAEMMRRV